MAENHLRVAERYIARVEEGIIKQLLLIDHLANVGRDTAAAEELLHVWRHDLQVMREYRDTILGVPDVLSR